MDQLREDGPTLPWILAATVTKNAKKQKTIDLLTLMLSPGRVY